MGAYYVKAKVLAREKRLYRWEDGGAGMWYMIKSLRGRFDHVFIRNSSEEETGEEPEG